MSDDDDAHVLEIVSRQPWQNANINFVLMEHLVVSLKP